MPRYEHIKPGTPDRTGVNPFTKEQMVFPGRPSEHRFWEVELTGSRLRFGYGHVGQMPVCWARDVGDVRLALKAYQGAIAAHIAAGYECKGDCTVVGMAEAPMPFASWDARVAGAPDDEAVLQACADDLRPEGDPLDGWADASHGHVAEVEMRGPFVRTARLALTANEPPERRLAEVVRGMLGHPVGRFLRHLTIGLNDERGRCSYDDVIAAIAGMQPPALAQLFIGDFAYPDELEMSWAKVGDCEPLWSLPSLRELRVQGAEIRLGAVFAPTLEVLELRTGGLPRAAVASLLEGDAPRLRCLRIWFGSSDYGGECDVQDLEPLLDGGMFPNLTELGIMNAEFSDEVCVSLVRSKLLGRLTVLDLSMGTLTDDGAAVLAQGAASLAHLAKLDVSDNLLGDRGIAGLAKLGAMVVTGEQRPGDAYNRFVSVAE